MANGKNALRSAAVLLVIGFSATLWVLKGGPDSTQLIKYISTDIRVALLVSTALFLLKCLAFFIPTTLIYAICGYILPAPHAFVMCIIGCMLFFSFAFYSGRKTPKTKSTYITALFVNGKGGFLPALLLHCVRFIPCHTVGVYLGKTGAPYLGCLCGSVVGMLPTIAVTLSIMDSLPTPNLPFLFPLLGLLLLFALCNLFFIKKH